MKPANDNARTTVMSPSTPRSDKLFAGAAGAIALAAIVAGLLITDPPWIVRKQRLDDQRAHSLSMLSDFINRYHTDNGKLPQTLDELVKSSNYRPYLSLVDPATGVGYDFIPGEARAYRLCATFDLDTSAASKTGGTLWSHKAGRHCFDLSAPASTAAAMPGTVTIDGKAVLLPQR